MVRKMLGFTRHENRSLQSFMERTNGRIKHILESAQVESWDFKYLCRLFAWAGHVRRFEKYDPTRLTYRVLRFKDMKWIHDFADGWGQGRQGHGRVLRVWRWEQPLRKKMGHKWHQKALDKRGWAANIEELAEWRRLHRR